MKFFNCLPLLAVSAGIITSASANVTIDWVTVGNAGNAAQSSSNRSHTVSGGDGYGAVGWQYAIGKNEVTIAQYTVFLNAKAASDPYALWNSSMESDANIAGITRSGTSGSYTYSVTGSGLRPITYVSWFDAARFTNWMHNGQGSGDTETGAYTLVGGQINGTAPAKNVGAKVWIPTENEWFKAAYYDPTHMSGEGGYWLYANQSDNMTSNSPLVDGAANYYDGDFVGSGSSSVPTGNALTDAGAYGTDSQNYYGLNDMAGNVLEWNDLFGASDSSRGYRGGSWGDFQSGLQSSFRRTPNASSEGNGLGFRLAAVPEPTGMVLSLLLISGCVCRRQR